MSNPMKDRTRKMTLVHEKFHCDHLKTEMRARTVKGGGIHRVKQCLKCGKACSQPLRKEKVLEIVGTLDLKPFDDSLMEDWESSYALECKKVIEGHESVKAFERAEFFRDYEKYLKSYEWEEKRKKVFNRAAYVCEGCGENEATQVHHLSYQNVGAEFLFELVAICEPCHDRLHQE